MVHAPVLTPLLWRCDALSILDQRLLPHREVWIEARASDDVAEAISGMAVRGAPAIGIAAAYGVALAALTADAAGADPLDAARRAAERLARTRPTAVNLRWALDRMLRVAAATPAGVLAVRLEAEAVAIHAEDLEANRRLGLLGRELLGASATVLTHCNAGALATGGYGTALGVIRAAVEGGSRIAVFADETRPYLQGARLTAWELARDGIDVTLITDAMAGHFFRQGTFDAVIVGADRIAANGDTANKIGTYTLAILASHHRVPFYVAAPTSTIDLSAPDGSAIPIEERTAQEVMEATGLDQEGRMATVRLAPAGVAARHPAFDVTPAELITAIVTERGIARAPYGESLRVVAG